MTTFPLHESMTEEEMARAITDIQLWQAARKASDEQRWDNQEAANIRMEKNHEEHGIRLGSLEKKIMWIAGVAAAVGGLIGPALTQLLTPQ